MNELLVSVRSAAECEAAMAGNVRIVDVKDPARGSLGRPDWQTVAQVANAVAGRCAISVALGELTSYAQSPDAALYADRLGSQVDFVKLGLSGCANRTQWVDDWQRVLAAWPANVARVAVAYADASLAAAPDWRTVLAHAVAAKCSVFLVDTFDKSQGTLLDFHDLQQLNALRAEVHAAGLKLALAGSLNIAAVSSLAAQVQPDVLAVRTAACAGGRNGVVCRDAIRRLQNAVSISDSSTISSKIFCKK